MSGKNSEENSQAENNQTQNQSPEQAKKQAQNKAQNKAWESKSLGTRWQHAFFYVALRYGGLMPGRFILFFVVCYYTFIPYVRKRILPYAEHMFGPAGYIKRSRQVFAIYHQFGLVLLERAAAGILGNLRYEGKNEYGEALAREVQSGSGLIVLSGHMGTWQTGLAGLNFLNRAVNIVQHRAKEDIDKHYFEHAMEDVQTHPADAESAAQSANTLTPPRFIDPAEPFGGLLSMLSALRDGQIVCLMGDRLVEKDTLPVPVEFLGGTIQVPGVPYILASRSQCPIAVVFTLRTGHHTARGILADMLHVPPGLPKNSEAVKPYAQAFANALEKMARLYPDQFFNFYDLWQPGPSSEATKTSL